MRPGLDLIHSATLWVLFLQQFSSSKTVVRSSLHLTTRKEKGTVQKKPWDVHLSQSVLVVGSGSAWEPKEGPSLHYRNWKPAFVNRIGVQEFLLCSGHSLHLSWNHRAILVGLRPGNTPVAGIQKIRFYFDDQTRVMTMKSWYCYRNSMNRMSVV